ncbi:hypothetical protein ACPFP2_13185 [Micromonospora citrea]|uniref:hypothetical protein n=1 Tax=Micromonospora citrea TaxID=47855 RepID=UPI003C66281B
MEAATGDALLWDHRKKTWSYNPELVVRFLDDYRNIDRYEEVGREVAERVAALVSGGPPLPAEDVITQRFHEANASPSGSD